MAVLDGTTTTDLIANWWQNQYVSESQTRWECRDPYEHSRWLTIKRWRLDPSISVWTCLEGESPPTTWARKPTLASLRKEARQAWARADPAKAEALYYQWTHHCPDPYYCRMHGIGSD
jgi:hypothetical protein